MGISATACAWPRISTFKERVSAGRVNALCLCGQHSATGMTQEDGLHHIKRACGTDDWPSAGAEQMDVCTRCKFTACSDCKRHKKTGACYCRDENFGIPYPPPNRRKFYQTGVW